jgi:hypothetical protein
VKGVDCCGCPGATAAKDDVTTTRLTPATLAALRTRRVPSRAGTMRSFSCLGRVAGKGDAGCKM